MSGETLTFASQSDADALLGPGLLGWCFHLFVFGVTVQTLASYTRTHLYHRDTLKMKLLLWVVVALETLQIGFNLAQLWRFTTSQRRDVISMLGGNIIDIIAPLPAGLVALLVQSFLVHRAARLFRRPSHNTAFQAFLALPILLSWTGSILTCASAWVYVKMDRPTLGAITYNSALGIWLWCAAFVDIVVMITLTAQLRRLLAGFNQGTDAVLRGLISLALQTGTPTAILALVGAIVGFAFPSLAYQTTNIPEAFWVGLPGLYTLSLVCTLAARESFRNDLAGLAGPIKVDVDVQVKVEHRDDLERAARSREKTSQSVESDETLPRVRERSVIPMVDLFKGNKKFEGRAAQEPASPGSPGVGGETMVDEVFDGRRNKDTVLEFV